MVVQQEKGQPAVDSELLGADMTIAELDSDAAELAKLGYKQEFRREWQFWSTFSFAFSMSGLLGSVGVTFVYPVVAGGPAAAVWCWFAGMIGCLCIAWSVAELISCFPTSGGMYYTLAHLVPKKYVPIACWIDGWLYVVGCITSTASGDFGCAQLIAATASAATDFTYVPEPSHVTAIAIAVMLSHAAFNTLPSRYQSGIVKYYFIINIGATIAVIIHLLVKCQNINTASFTFTEVIPNTGWKSPGWSFMFGFLSVSWVMTSYDGTSRISEETEGAAFRVPLAIATAQTATALLGWVLVIVLALVMGTDMDKILNGPAPMPIVAIFYNVLGRRAATAYLSISVAITWFGGCVGVCSLSRAYWSFARDRGMPFHKFWTKLDSYTGNPLRCVWLITITNILLSLINLGSEIAIEAIFSVCAIATDWSYVVCIAAYLLNAEKFGVKKGPFHMGRFSKVVNAYAVLWTMFVSIVFVFPNYVPVTAENMNYTCVLLGFAFIGAGGWWVLGAHKFYQGPVNNVDDIDSASTSGFSTAANIMNSESGFTTNMRSSESGFATNMRSEKKEL
ncbi:GABA-specific permease [Trichomonascus vanleenenianus]|uniref:GABA-specific permease n=1 Tax=Trichomonascus vanleenenianus TaxID=2268995 RepID=UPI003ECB9BA4